MVYIAFLSWVVTDAYYPLEISNTQSRPFPWSQIHIKCLMKLLHLSNYRRKYLFFHTKKVQDPLFLVESRNHLFWIIMMKSSPKSLHPLTWTYLIDKYTYSESISLPPKRRNKKKKVEKEESESINSFLPCIFLQIKLLHTLPSISCISQQRLLYVFWIQNWQLLQILQ